MLKFFAFLFGVLNLKPYTCIKAYDNTLSQSDIKNKVWLVDFGWLRKRPTNSESGTPPECRFFFTKFYLFIFVFLFFQYFDLKLKYLS